MHTQEQQDAAVNKVFHAVYDNAYKLYEKFGASAVNDLGVKLKLPFIYCEPCDAETPEHDGCCLTCGSQYPKPKNNDLDINDKDCRISTDNASAWVRCGGILVHLATGVPTHPGMLVVETFNEKEDPELMGEPMEQLAYFVEADNDDDEDNDNEDEDDEDEKE